MRPLPDHDVDRWCAEQTVGLHVPPESCQQRVAGRGETRRVGDRGPADEGDAGLGGRAERVDQPPAGYVVKLRCYG